jgi:tRNA modification GTPase
VRSTCVCQLTPRGRSAVAVVAVAGERAIDAVDRFFQAANGRAREAQSLSRVVYGCWGGATGEDLVVCRRAEDEVEIHCHGGYLSASQIVADLAGAGCVEVDWHDWLAREEASALATEARIALADAPTLRTATILLDQYHGALERELGGIAEDLENARGSEAVERLEQLLHFADVGSHLTRPWSVVIAGRPNVGKSSLLNALAGFQRAIVFDQPGTTRDVVTATTAVAGWPVELSDTAGLHRATKGVETAGIALAKQQLDAADLVLWVVDATELGAQSPLSLCCAQAKAAGLDFQALQALVVVNKADLIEKCLEYGEQAVVTSATRGEGIDRLLSMLASRLVPEIPPQGDAVPFQSAQVNALQEVLDAIRAASFEKAIGILRRCFHPSAQC